MNLTRQVWARRRAMRSRINRAPSPLLAVGLPYASVVLGSILTTIVVIASAPVLPPLGFLIFVAWRQLRPGLLPLWSGLPLGLLDDLYSGQPFGSAALLWSLAAILLDVVETRIPWRGFVTEWLVSTALIATYAITSLILANMASVPASAHLVIPQIVVSVLAYPMICRIVALIDRARLFRIVEIG